jgi:hypothetical protein
VTFKLIETEVPGENYKPTRVPTLSNTIASSIPRIHRLLVIGTDCIIGHGGQ